jgi:hypothetical protein
MMGVIFSLSSHCFYFTHSIKRLVINSTSSTDYLLNHFIICYPVKYAIHLTKVKILLPLIPVVEIMLQSPKSVFVILTPVLIFYSILWNFPLAWILTFTKTSYLFFPPLFSPFPIFDQFATTFIHLNNKSDYVTSFLKFYLPLAYIRSPYFEVFCNLP